MPDELTSHDALASPNNGPNKGKKSSNNTQTEDVKKVKREKRLSTAIAGTSIQSGTLTYRYSTTPVAWKDLKTGDTFTRSADGKVVYMRTSRSMAYPLDRGLEQMTVPGDAQNLEVYRVWITTF